MRAMRMIAAVAAVTWMIVMLGCSSQRANTPSYKDAVKQSLDSGGFKDVTVSEDRDKGVITLGGKVISSDEKAKVEELVKSAAPGMVVANQVSIEPAGYENDARNIESNVDKGIQDNFKAALIGNKLEDQHIEYEAKNGVLTLTGEVETPRQRAQAEKLADTIPNVEQVVNKLDVRRHKGGR
jgi:hyperosmotically inducible periplasmic protein